MSAIDTPADPPATPPSPDSLSDFFPASQVAEAERYRQAFAAAASAQDLTEVFRQALALDEQLLAPVRARYEYADWPLLEGFREADFGLPGLTAACAAECTEPAFKLEVQDFAEASAKTPGGADDAYFQLLGELYPYARIFDGELSGWSVYFEQTWDYGGHSLLGKGSHLAFLLRIDTFFRENTSLDAHEAFTDEVGELRARLMKDLFEGSRCSGLPAAEVLKEIDGIRRQVRLSEAEGEALTTRRRAFEDPADHGIEVDCREQQCACDSG